MPNKILNSATYHDEIRGRIGVSKSVLSDADIDAPSVLPLGEVKIIRAVPDYAVLVDEDAIYLYAATICMVASIIAPSMAGRVAKSKKDFDFTIEAQSVDWSQRKEDLIEEAQAFVDQISTQDAGNASLFGLAGPTRAASACRVTLYDVDAYV